MTTFVQDIRYALRSLVQQPGFTAVVVITLALGIGANTAIFSVIHGALLKPLSFAEPDRLFLAYQSAPEQGRDRGPASPPNFADWRQRSQSFEDLVAFNGGSFNLAGDEVPERVAGMYVSAGYFELMRAPLISGRGFLPEEDREGAAAVVVLSHRFWQRRFGGDPGLVGQAIELNGELHTVVGIAEPGFNFPNSAELWTPHRFASSVTRDNWYILVLGRLAPGVSETAARAEMKGVAAQLASAYPEFNRGVTIELISLQERMVQRSRPALLVLLGAVAFVLLIACANVASLLLSRATARQREVAIRLALGAGRWRLLRQFLTESVLLSMLGGVLGVVFAAWGTDALLSFYADQIPRSSAIELNATVLAFGLGVSLLAGILLTLAPAFQLRDSGLGDPLREGGRGQTGSARSGRTRGVLVATEVALALVLLIGASLMLRSFAQLTQVDLGFSPGALTTFELNLPDADYEAQQQRTDFFDAALSRIRTIPGVESAAAIYPLPLSGEIYGEALVFEGRPQPEPSEMPVTHVRLISSEYFETMGIAVERGRSLTEDDQRMGRPVAIINRTLAAEHFAGKDPLAQRLAIFDANREEPVWLEVVGVVGDVRHEELSHVAEPELYVPLGLLSFGVASLVVKAPAGLASVGDLVRHEVAQVDPRLPLFNVGSMEQLVLESLASSRFLTVLLGFFAAVALTLALIGVYGVLSYWVGQRTREIGIRIVLGVSPWNLMSMVVSQGIRPVLLGVIAGLIGAALVTRYLSSQLYGVSSTDPVTFGVVALVLIAVAVAATLVPARRATSVSPVKMLREE